MNGDDNVKELRKRLPVDERGREVFWADLEARAVDTAGDTVQFEGYAAVFDQRAQIWPGFYEEIAPSAFNNTLKRSDIFLLWNHDPSMPLARTGAGNLELSVDDKGLFAKATFVDTSYARDAAVLLRDKVSSKMSFGFTVPPGGDTITELGDNKILRRVTDTRLWEVSIVGTWPAYNGTSAKVRSDAFGMLCRSLGLDEEQVIDSMSHNDIVDLDTLRSSTASQQVEPGAVTTSEDAERAEQTVPAGIPTSVRLLAESLSEAAQAVGLSRFDINGAAPGQAAG